MDALDRHPRAIDICAKATPLPPRVFVMGDRAIRREPATPDDIAEMRRITIEALNAGAFGFTTSRTDSHKTPDGELVPSRDADAEELIGIGSALTATGSGAFGINSDFDDEDYEFAWMTKVARDTGRPGWFLRPARPAGGSGSCGPTVIRTRRAGAACSRACTPRAPLASR